MIDADGDRGTGDALSSESLPPSVSGPGPRTLGIVGAVLVALAVAVFIVVSSNRPATGDVGQLSESIPALPADIALPVLHDATAEWGLSGLALTPAADAMAGGSAVGDIDGDTVTELIIANGSVAVLRWNGDGYDEPRLLDIDDAIGVATRDVDRDGFDDVLISRVGDVDSVVWGGDWLTSDAEPDSTALAAPGQSSGLLAGELSGDDLIDIVRLGRGMGGEPAPDVLWVATADRRFESTELPVADRFSLAGELVDVDEDGLLDIWITRDVGWSEGGDSILSRQGSARGPWEDVAPALGAALEVDGMGVTIADLDGNGDLDAYVSDLGDNQLLFGSNGTFTERFGTGAAHIRPVGAADDMISSTWGTGALDINLDGVLDLVLISGGFPEGAVRNKIEDTEVAVSEPPAILLGHGGGVFTDVWASLGIDLDVVGRGLTIADLDSDGDDDLVIVDRRGPVYLLRNDSSGSSITVSLAPKCLDHSGRVVAIDSEASSFRRLLAPHGYASSHADQVIVGTAAAGVVVDGVSAAEAVSIGENVQRTRLQLECG